MAHNTKNEIGNKYGKLTVISRSDKKDKSRLAYWDCLCECGNKVVVSGSNLRTGNTTSCGCVAKDVVSKRSFKDETGNKYGLLTVLERSSKNGGKSGIFWKCKCDCGTIIDVLGCNLRNGHTISCGCIKSIGEYNISKLLTENNINFQKQIKFDDLRGKNKQYLRYDFGIYDKNNNLIKLIEFDGDQHTNTNNPYYSVDGFERDRIKDEYAKSKGIPLIRIDYSKRDVLKLEDLI